MISFLRLNRGAAIAFMAGGLMFSIQARAADDAAKADAVKADAAKVDAAQPAAETEKPAPDKKPAKGKMAVAQIHGAGADKEKVKGTVTFTEVEGGVKIMAKISGLTPGKHGFHIHEKAIEGDDFKTAGGHWNPSKAEHGDPKAPPHHAGDLGNIVADDKGDAHMQVIVRGISVEGEAPSVVGKAMIIHAGEDDLKSQPAGDAGDRIGGGNIEVKGAKIKDAKAADKNPADKKPADKKPAVEKPADEKPAKQAEEK